MERMADHDGRDALSSDVPTLPEFPASLEPHELLEIVAGELRGPLGAVEGWARVIAGDPRLEAISLEAAESIPALTTYMRALLARVEQYLAARGA
jgi:hypothetical protein